MISRDEGLQKTVVKPITRLFRNKNKQIYTVTLTRADGSDEESLGTTEEHPFYVVGTGWVEASDLKVGDQIYAHGAGDSAGHLLVKSVTLEDERQDTYNFEVAESHTYFVGQLSAWVHNACGPSELLDNGGRPLDDNTIVGYKGNVYIKEVDGSYVQQRPATDAELNNVGLTRDGSGRVVSRWSNGNFTHPDNKYANTDSNVAGYKRKQDPNLAMKDLDAFGIYNTKLTDQDLLDIMWDPKRKQYLAAEGIQTLRFENERKITITGRSGTGDITTHEFGEVDLMGGPVNQGHFDFEKFSNAITDHFNKSGVDYTAIDMTNISAAQRINIHNYINQQGYGDKMIIFGET